WLSVAVQACLPILHLGFRWYRDWGTLYLVPEEYEYSEDETDEAGVVHEVVDTVSGQTMPLGSVVLSVADVEASGWGDGYNVVIHEMAHVIDRQNGVIDGAPPLHRGMSLETWTRVFTDAYGDLQGRVVGKAPPRRGKRVPAYAGPIDAYAAEAPEEFFAVVTELFFENPGGLRGEYPDIYDQLMLFYRQDPLQRRGGAPR
ncbi:MAG TPA: M90 family metallopeptidase, partial [Spirochaetia bacterium]|nr:M90 family metallopeptidase [Spirochaetia bacterium]